MSNVVRCRTCMQTLRPDGTCVWKCPPKAPREQRRNSVGVKPKREVLLGVGEAQAGLAKVDPVYAASREKVRARVMRGRRTREQG
jgi:hypothetical protein